MSQPVLNLEKIKTITISYGGLTEGTTGTMEFAAQISGKKVRKSNPKAEVHVIINNELLYPKVAVEYFNGRKTDMTTTNMSFKQILHAIEDEICVVNQEAEKEYYDKFRVLQHDYIMGGIKMWEQKHKEMIKELNEK